MAEHFFIKVPGQLIQALKSLTLPSFHISIKNLKSFSACPYISISEQTGSFEHIHKALTSIFSEDSPCEYIPHITLALYNDAYSHSFIKDNIKKLSKEVKVDTMKVNSLIFAQYKTNNVQGPYQVLQRISL